MKVINMALKKVWYDAIDKGVKTTEYRDMTDYWMGKLLDMKKYKGKTFREVRRGLEKGELKVFPADWTHVRFHHDKDNMTFAIDKLVCYNGHTTFAIKLGDRLK